MLSSPELRARYDKGGKEGLADVDFMDGGSFFSMLFGSDQFDHIIGELVMAAATRCAARISQGGGGSNDGEWSCGEYGQMRCV